MTKPAKPLLDSQQTTAHLTALAEATEKGGCPKCGSYSSFPVPLNQLAEGMTGHSTLVQCGGCGNRFVKQGEV